MPLRQRSFRVVIGCVLTVDSQRASFERFCGRVSKIRMYVSRHLLISGSSLVVPRMWAAARAALNLAV